MPSLDLSSPLSAPGRAPLGLVALALGLSGCAMGPSPETRIEDLRVLAIDVAPELAPGERVAADTLVVEPDGGDWLLATWTCTRGADGCAEGTVAAATGAWPGLVLQSGTGTAWVEAELAVAPELAAVASDSPAPLLSQFSLACAPGVCPILDALDQGLMGDAVVRDLSDPFTMLKRLPFAGVSLGLRTVSVSTRAADARHSNPTVEDCSPLKGGAWAVDAGAGLDVRCRWTSPSAATIQAFGYTTAGGWEGQEAADVFEPGVVDYTWFAPEEAEADVPLWIAFVDGDGGLAIWEGSATAR